MCLEWEQEGFLLSSFHVTWNVVCCLWFLLFACCLLVSPGGPAPYLPTWERDQQDLPAQSDLGLNSGSFASCCVTLGR